MHYNYSTSLPILDETGPSTAKKGILMIYDVFGLFAQTIRGADILATGFPAASDDAVPFKVFMSDFFGDNPSNITTFPPETPAHSKFTMAFMSGPANPDKTIPLIVPMMEEIKKAHLEIESWGDCRFLLGRKDRCAGFARGNFVQGFGTVPPEPGRYGGCEESDYSDDLLAESGRGSGGECTRASVLVVVANGMV